jgi:hypothetical protein
MGVARDDVLKPLDAPPKPKPPRGLLVAGVAGAREAPPNMETRSSRGLLDVPASRLAAAGVFDNISVAANPEGCPSAEGASSKSLEANIKSVESSERRD